MSTPETVRALDAGCGARLLPQRISPRPGHRWWSSARCPRSGRVRPSRNTSATGTPTGPQPRDRPAGGPPNNAVSSIAVPDGSRVQDRVVLAQTPGTDARRPRLLPAGARQCRAGRQLLRHAPQHRPAQERGAGVLGGFAAAGRAHTQRLLHRVRERSRRTCSKAAAMVAREIAAMQKPRSAPMS